MEIITKQFLVSSVAERYKKQYYVNKQWNPYTKFNPEQIYNKLLVAKDEKDVLEAIGNGTWTENLCHECGLDYDIIVILGEKPDYESNTAQVCPSCIRKALALLDGYKNE